MKRIWLALLLAGVVIGLPFLGKWLRRNAEPRCALHGLPIAPLYRVRIVEASGPARHFCCISCAQSWLERRLYPPASIEVTDESSGEPLDADAAYYVHSAVATNAVTGNRVHAFRDRADAEAHARTFAGRILPPGESPFRPPAP